MAFVAQRSSVVDEAGLHTGFFRCAKTRISNEPLFTIWKVRYESKPSEVFQIQVFTKGAGNDDVFNVIRFQPRRLQQKQRRSMGGGLGELELPDIFPGQTNLAPELNLQGISRIVEEQGLGKMQFFHMSRKCPVL